MLHKYLQLDQGQDESCHYRCCSTMRREEIEQIWLAGSAEEMACDCGWQDS
jgi:hypothetical protein